MSRQSLFKPEKKKYYRREQRSWPERVEQNTRREAMEQFRATPTLRFTVTNFAEGKDIVFALTKHGYVYQLGDDAPTFTAAQTYPKAAALARARYNVPPISGRSLATEAAR